jgi:tetratricopeptide (TPR) repeat protein
MPRLPFVVAAAFALTLLVSPSGQAATPSTKATAAPLARANALLRAGKYEAARTAIRAYLSKHPGDRDAELLLGVASSFLNDSDLAVAAYDSAGSIPARYAAVAAKAYADAAVEALKAKDNAKAIALASKSLTLQKSVNSLFIRGTAYANAQRYPEAIADLERAKTQATEGHADTATLNAIDSSLATSYIFGGQSDKGVALAQAVKQRDPANTRVDDTLAAYYNQRAVAAMQAGDKEGAVSILEKAAVSVPSRAVVLYVQAANVLSQGTSVDWKRVKAEADKALALDPNDARANYVAGIALANQSDRSGAISFLKKAKANAGSDASLNADIDTALKKLGQ